MTKAASGCLRSYKTDYQGRSVDLVQAFIEEEYKAFPVGLHDDMLDSLARMFDVYESGLPFPDDLGNWDFGNIGNHQGHWMGV